MKLSAVIAQSAPHLGLPVTPEATAATPQAPSQVPSQKKQDIIRQQHSHVKRELAMQQLNAGMEVLSKIPHKSFGKHPTYTASWSEPAGGAHCCAHDHPTVEGGAKNAKARFKRDKRLKEAEMQAIRNFVANFPASDVEGGDARLRNKNTRPISRVIAKQAEAILNRENTNVFPHTKHDLDILVSDALAEMVGKLVKYPNDDNTRNDAQVVLEGLTTHFPDFLKKSDYKEFFYGEDAPLWPPSQAHFKKSEPLPAEVLQRKLTAFSTQIREAEVKTNAMINGTGPQHTPDQAGLEAIEAYRAGAAMLLRMKKPDFRPTTLEGARVDHHNHMNPYDNNGKESNLSLLQWYTNFNNAFGVASSVVMPIPHQMTAPSFGGTEPAEVKGNPPFAYYTDTGARTEFYSHDRTHLDEINRLSGELTASLEFCATGLPIDVNRLDTVRQAATNYANAVVNAQIANGEKHIAVNFGELTGYKPQVPQDMLADNAPLVADAQHQFVDGSARVLTEIYSGAQQGIMAALEGHVPERDPDNGQPIGDVKIRITYHTDALPNAEAVNHPDNVKNPELGVDQAGRYHEFTTIDHLKQFTHAIDENLGAIKAEAAASPLPIKYHLQNAHMLGASVARNNFEDATRTPEMHSALKEYRDTLNNLSVTVDTSWLTASARAINSGIAQFLTRPDNESGLPDADMKEVSDIILKIDQIANNGFMFMSGADRYIDTFKSNGVMSLTPRESVGDTPEDQVGNVVLDMAMNRAAHQKAAAMYFTAVGMLVDKIAEPGVKEKLSEKINAGFDETGTALPGNYVGMAIDLAKSADTRGQQNVMPLVFGTDNLTPSNGRSGDLKHFVYTHQHAVFEMLLANEAGLVVQEAPVELSEAQRARKQAAKAGLEEYLSGSKEDQKYLGSTAQINTENIFDGRDPTRATDKFSVGKKRERDPNILGIKPKTDTYETQRAPMDSTLPFKQGTYDQVRVGTELPPREYGPRPDVVPPAPTRTRGLRESLMEQLGNNRT